MRIHKGLPGHILSFWLLLFVGRSATSTPLYQFTVTVDTPKVVIPEGKEDDIVHYVLTNTGTEKFWVFKFSTNASHPVVPDPTDRPGARYIGLDRSLGIEVDPGGTFKWEYLIQTPRADIHPDNPEDPDFGWRTFAPNISQALREGSALMSPHLPVNSGKVPDFDVYVIDHGYTPEPATGLLAGSALAALLVARFMARRRLRFPSLPHPRFPS